MDCSRSDQCDTVDCTVTLSPFDGTVLALTILPCRDPPGVRVVATDGSSREVIVDEDTMAIIDLGAGATLDITVEHLNDTIQIEVNHAIALYNCNSQCNKQ